MKILLREFYGRYMDCYNSFNESNFSNFIIVVSTLFQFDHFVFNAEKTHLVLCTSLFCYELINLHLIRTFGFLKEQAESFVRDGNYDENIQGSSVKLCRRIQYLEVSLDRNLGNIPF